MTGDELRVISLFVGTYRRTLNLKHQFAMAIHSERELRSSGSRKCGW